jgi:hypothetical protein
VTRVRVSDREAGAAAFLAPLAVRAVPEILSWPYPIGFDTLMYAGYAVGETFLRMPLPELLKTTSLLYLVYTLLYKALGDPLLPAKILGPLLTAAVGYGVYRFTRRAGLEPGTALLASLLATAYFVALRISWEMYRQMLATAFLLAALYLEAGPPARRGRLLQALLAFLTAWAHEFITVILLAHKAARSLASRGLRRAVEEALPALPAALLLLYQVYNPHTHALQVPVLHVEAPTRLHLLLYITGFLAYLYAPLSPLLLAGLGQLRDPPLRDWALTCLALTYLPVLNPQGVDILWFRWAILLNYPVAVAAARGFERLTRGGAGGRLGRGAALATLALNAVFTATYLALPPEQQWNKYFGDWNAYKQYVQTSMLQSSIPLRDVEPTIEAVRWVDSLPGDKVLVLHEAFHNWAQLYARNTRLVRVNEQKLSSPLRQNVSQLLLQAASSQNATVYTIWWVSTTWYNMTRPPPQFKPLKTFQDIAVYVYEP